ncbi:hypothetical protein KV404_002271 [Listeria monocytogenes]|nr:hypothetical protein [Listeria monocytogenes]
MWEQVATFKNLLPLQNDSPFQLKDERTTLSKTKEWEGKQLAFANCFIETNALQNVSVVGSWRSKRYCIANLVLHQLE